jgi:hypothetical protein
LGSESHSIVRVIPSLKVVAAGARAGRQVAAILACAAAARYLASMNPIPTRLTFRS